MSGVRARGSMRALRERMAGLGAVVATRAAVRSAPRVSALAREDFASGHSAYGDARALGAHGPVTLIRTGALQRTLGFTAQGTIMRAVLSVPYARYMIGRFRILPIGGRGRLPTKWSREIEAITRDVLRGES